MSSKNVVVILTNKQFMNACESLAYMIPDESGIFQEQIHEKFMACIRFLHGGLPDFQRRLAKVLTSVLYDASVVENEDGSISVVWVNDVFKISKGSQ